MIAVLLPPTLRAPFSLPGVGEALTAEGHTPVFPEVPDDDTAPHAARYVARASLEISRLVTDRSPVVLVAEGDSGPLLGAVGAAQRSAHRPVLGYVLVDAPLPQPGSPTRDDLTRNQLLTGVPARADEPAAYRTERLPTVPDWPDAPCGYLLTDPAFAHPAHLAGMRGWVVRDATGDRSEAAGELAALMGGLLR
ncbi:hypothetical protein [Nocardiopsis ganjiahuensis]|uniref:hypothetical protein n=1 Tax=Nocardiopsis ganjiahuensis TaxID=239984 RepID=UPI0003460A95|nr:hypothetical protein [Nocardiopsis ganjiahuensis]